jgi:hypothetical protein
LDSNNWITSVAHVLKFVHVVAAFAMFLVAVAHVAGAQVQSGDPAPRRFHIPAAVIAPGQFVYETTLERGAGTTVLGTRTVAVSQTAYAGAPAWLLLETRSGDGIPAADSLLAGIVDLHPIHWSSTLGGARLAAEFRGDTVYGATSAPSGRRSMVATVPSGTLISSSMLETVLRLLPLQTGWEDSTGTLSISLNGNSVVPTRLSVVSEESVRVPAGTFDCWVVAVHADPGRGLYWVTKRDPIVVRSVLDVPTLGGAQLVSNLTRIVR